MPEAGAQQIPSLPAAPEFSKGVLPPGIEYRVVSNKARVGYADFALVGTALENNTEMRSRLDHLYHFADRKVYSFLSDKGVSFGPQGMFLEEDGYSVYRFQDVPVAKQEVCDSTLLMLLDMASLQKSGQCIVVCGDVDAPALISRLKTMSLMVLPQEKAEAEEQLVWFDRKLQTSLETAPGSYGYSRIGISWRSPRPAKSDMGTIIPYVSRAYSELFAMMFADKLLLEASHRAVPVADVKYDFCSASQNAGDEVLQISFAVPVGEEAEAVSMCGSVAAALSGGKVSAESFASAKQAYLLRLDAAPKSLRSNAEYVDRCVASFVFASDLSGFDTLRSVLDGREVNLSDEAGWFNDYISSIVREGGINTSINAVCPPSAAPVKLAECYTGGWRSPLLAVREDKTLAKVNYQASSKIKIKHKKKESLTGGEIWTYNNGVKVIYKRVQGSGKVNYAFMINGGARPLFSQMLDLPVKDGIDMRLEVGYNDMRILGEVPVSSFQEVLDAVLRLKAYHKVDSKGFDYWKKCRQLEQMCFDRSREGIFSALDRGITISNEAPSYTRVEDIDESYPLNAQKYFDNQFTRFNDGYILVVGDMEEYRVRKILAPFIAELPVSNRSGSRDIYEFSMSSGRTVKAEELGKEELGAGEKGMFVELASGETVNMQRHFACRIAGEILQRRLASVFAAEGVNVGVETIFETIPSGRSILRVSIIPCSEKSLPLSVTPATDMYKLHRVYMSMLVETAALEVTPAELSAAKALVLNEHESMLADRRWFAERVLDRYSLNRDYITNYRQKLASIREEAVTEILQHLSGGPGMEYIVY